MVLFAHWIRLTTEAAAELQDFYMQLRMRYRSFDSAPITTRQLESLIRLAEARARSEMRRWVTKQDAIEVVEIMYALNLSNPSLHA
jgi:DNA helicase MCM8